MDYQTFLNSRHIAGLLPDHLIRSHVGIKPYADRQVKQENGRRVISYGESSGGYDIRLGHKFKVFTDLMGAVVDPLNFDQDSFVDVEVGKAPDMSHDWVAMPLASGTGPQPYQCSHCHRVCTKPEVYGVNDCPGKIKAIQEQQRQGHIIVDLPHVLIPPNSFALGESLEEFDMPRDTLGICVGKSTYARCGIIVNVTPLEPGWKGKLTIEMSNTTPLPAKVYAGMGIAQILFFRLVDDPEVSYADRGGKYQGQTGITLPR